MSYAYATRCDLDAATRTRDEPVRDRLSTPTRRWLRSALVYPSTEVDSCGHATLASAHLLWESGLLKQSEAARFHTRSGLLTAEQNRNLIELNFPALVEVPATAPVELTTALSVTPTYVGQIWRALSARGHRRRHCPRFEPGLACIAGIARQRRGRDKSCLCIGL